METPIGLTADPEQINAWLANAILESALGKTIRAKAEATLRGYQFEQEVEAAIKGIVASSARDLVEKDEAFRARIAAAVQDRLTPELIGKLADAAMAKIDRY